MRQAFYTPVFEGPGWVTLTGGMKAKILQCTHSYLVWGIDIHAEPNYETIY